jgi:hypothetical protein
VHYWHVDRYNTINTWWRSFDNLGRRLKMMFPTSQWRALEATDDAIISLNLSDIVAPNIFEVQISSNQPMSNGCSMIMFRRLRQVLARVIKCMIPLKNIPRRLVKKLTIMRRSPIKYWQKLYSPAKVMPTENINPYPSRRTEAVKV